MVRAAVDTPLPRSRAEMLVPVFIAAAALALIWLGIVYVQDFVRVDDCLDSGGSYDYVRGVCDHAVAHQYIPFLARYRMFASVTLLSVAAALVLALRVASKRRAVIADSTV